MARTRKTAMLTLPGGHIDDKTELHTVCEIIELDHKVEKDYSDKTFTTVDLVARHVVAIGPYKDAEYIKAAVPKLAKGDFDWILIQIRILSLGSKYKYPSICPRPSCRYQAQFTHDLDTIELIEMPDPMARNYRYSTTDEIELLFRELIASDTEALADIIEKGVDELPRFLGLLLLSVDGVTIEESLKKKHQKLKKGDWTKHVSEAVTMMEKAEITQAEREEIRMGLRKQRGYPDRKIRARCPKATCGTDYAHMLPINPDFIAPSLGDQMQHGTL